MATLQEIVDALDNYIETANGLNVSARKGFPDFKRPDVEPPLAALLYGGSRSGAGEIFKRIGAGATAVVVTLQVYATDEVNLFALAEKLQAMRKRKIVLSAGDDGQQVRVYVGEDERLAPEPEDPKELRHTASCTIVLAYE